MENLRNLHPALFVLGALVGLLQHSMPLWAEEVSLFDGRTLQGWDYTEGVWRVEDGAVTAGSYEKKFQRNEFICTKKVYANFELKLKIKCSGDPKTGLINSGIQIRSARLPNGGAAGYQVDCGKGWFGKIYDEHRRGLIYPGPVDEPTLLKAVDTYGWNEYRILAEGPRIQVWINGIKASDYTEKNPNIPLDGVIAPQIHSGGHVVVQFKDITIRELPATPGAPTWESLGGATAALAKIQKPKARQPQPQAPKRPGKKTQSGRTEAWNPEEERAGFTVPPGFKIELVASEEHGVINPIDLTFDDAGRLWTQTAQMYPLDPVTGIKWGDLLRLMDNEDAQANNPDFQRIRNLYRLKSKGQDKILILDDITKPASKPLHVWADGLTIPQSILPYKDGAYVCHGSELFLLRDTDNDGKSDKMEPVLGGFGFTDTHTMAHLLIRGPGKYIHFSHGALNKGLVTAVASGKQARVDAACQVRFGLDHQDFEVISSGPNNMWGLQLRANGQWYGSEANDIGYSVTPWEPGSAIGGVARKTIRPYQPTLPAPHKFRVGGTGLSGLAFPDDSAGCFPVDDWKDVALLANPITSTVNAVRVFRNPDGTVGSEHLPDFLTSQDDWFRPVNLEFGPDGCLYISDFYNKIISHNEVTTAHPDRDKSHGRIWRVRHDNQEPRKIPDVTKAGPEELLAHLKSPLLWEKRAAWHQIADRGITSLAKDLSNLAADSKEDPVTRIHALWSLEESGHFDRQLVDTLLASENGDLRREAIRSLATFDIAPDTVASLVAGFIHDDNCMVRSQTIRTLGDLDNATPSVIAVLVDACKPALDGNQFGGSYERNLERFLARMALEKSSAALAKYLSKKAAAILRKMSSGQPRHWMSKPGAMSSSGFGPTSTNRNSTPKPSLPSRKCFPTPKSSPVCAPFSKTRPKRPTWFPSPWPTNPASPPSSSSACSPRKSAASWKEPKTKPSGCKPWASSGLPALPSKSPNWNPRTVPPAPYAYTCQRGKCPLDPTSKQSRKSQGGKPCLWICAWKPPMPFSL
jgi:putative membrane-bound dehydrogenase-like protein